MRIGKKERSHLLIGMMKKILNNPEHGKFVNWRGKKKMFMKKTMLIILFCMGLIFSIYPMIASGKENVKNTNDSKIVQIESGIIKGNIEDGIRQFKGIPYAAPPVGDLRWRPPQKVAPWKGTRDCTKFGSACPQPAYVSMDYDSGPPSEDCLFVNVWTPAKKADEKLPVMVWIHGGGFSRGSSSFKIYDGQNLAKEGVIVVSMNYRLGPLGFLTHPLLSKESPHGVSGNYGLLDQVAALKWIKRNISAFGGNPDKVTIFGESAGAISTSLLMLSPLAKGLFQGVIAESGNPLVGIQYVFTGVKTKLKQAEKVGEEYAKKLGCDSSKNILKNLRSKTPDELLDACDFTLGIESTGIQFIPVIDGWIFPKNAATLLNTGKYADVSILIGTNANEGNSFVTKVTLSDYKNWVKKILGKDADTILGLFPASNDKTAQDAYYKLLTVLCFRQPAEYVSRVFAGNKKKVYLYRFARIPDTEDAKEMGAYHGIELLYVFGCLPKTEGYDKTDFELSKVIMKYWTNFAKKQNPNSPDLPKWPAYNNKKAQYIEFGDKINIRKETDKKEYDVIHKILKEKQVQ